MELDICRGNLREPFMDDPDFQEILGAIDEVRVIERSVLEDELYVLGRGGGSQRILDLLRLGKKFNNPDNSHVAYAVGLTDDRPVGSPSLDFDRGRTEAADIDIDFADTRRDEVKEYLRRKFKNVAAIATFTTFKDKGVIRDAARVFQVPLSDVNKALKNIEPGPNDFIEDFVKSPEGSKFARQYPEVIDLARQLRGKVRSRGMHPAGIVISSRPITDYAPIETAKPTGRQEREALVSLDKDEVEKIGLIKMDFLGLTALSIVDETLRLIEENRGEKIDLAKIPLDDANVYQMLSQGQTKGVFQVTAAPYTKLIQDMGGVHEFNDLAASNALVRPGAANTIGGEYIARKKGKKKVKYLHPDMQEYTSDTYGCILYQEQVMLTLVRIGGFSESEADKVRKIIGKKKDVKEFDAYKDKFIEGASAKITREQAAKLWKDFEAHAGYSFNKSHAVAYSLLSYQTAWLKYHYPQEFIVANLRHESDKAVRAEFMIEAIRMGIEIKMPHVNKSGIGYTIEGKDIRIGLADIKYVSENAAQKLMEYRPFGSYEHLREIIMEKGNGLTTRVLHGMNAIGAAEFSDNPLTGEEDDNMYEYLGFPSFSDLDWPEHITKQLTPIHELDPEEAGVVKGMVQSIRRGDGWSLIDFIDASGKVGVFDEENTSILVGEIYLAVIAGNRIARAVRRSELDEDSVLKIFVDNDDFGELEEEQYYVLSFKTRRTKAGDRMAHVVLVDRYRNLIPAMVFKGQYPKAATHMKEGTLVEVKFGETKDGSRFIGDIRV